MQKYPKSDTRGESAPDIDLACRQLELDVVLRKAKHIQDEIDVLSDKLAKVLISNEK